MRTRLREERKKLNLTQKQMAEIFGISEIYQRKLEKGSRDPGRDLMLKMELYLGVSARELFPDLFKQINDTFRISKTG